MSVMPLSANPSVKTSPAVNQASRRSKEVHAGLTIVEMRCGLPDKRAVRKKRQRPVDEAVKSAARENEEANVFERPPVGTRQQRSLQDRLAGKRF